MHFFTMTAPLLWQCNLSLATTRAKSLPKVWRWKWLLHQLQNQLLLMTDCWTKRFLIFCCQLVCELPSVSNTFKSSWLDFTMRHAPKYDDSQSCSGREFFPLILYVANVFVMQIGWTIEGKKSWGFFWIISLFEMLCLMLRCFEINVDYFVIYILILRFLFYFFYCRCIIPYKWNPRIVKTEMVSFTFNLWEI